MLSCQNNPEKSYTAKKTKHTPSGYSLFHCLQIVHLNRQKNKLDCYKGKDCMKKLCKDLREHATEIINYVKKKKDTANW